MDPADLKSGRLSPADYARNFGDAHPPLNRTQALIEAERCYYCFDAPCQTACPTGIDVPSFIQRIAQDNLRGAAEAILTANPLGGICARVCPTEVLCEQACVRNANESKPVEIGLLQRFAVEGHFAQGGKPLFTRGQPTGRRVAVVGAGPAGLAAAHGLAWRGHEVTLFDAADKLGGLNEYGLATYKVAGGFAQREIAWLLSIGGITPRLNCRLGRDITLDGLLAEHDAVFLGLGLQGVNALGIAEPELPDLQSSVRDAVDFIAELRQNAPEIVPVGRRVVVIGGGMTAVDAAVQSRLLGAEQVTLIYRRGPEGLSASEYEQHWAQTHGVSIRCWARPLAVEAAGGVLRGMRFAATRLEDGRLVDTGEQFFVEADLVLRAIGQAYEAEPAGQAIALEGGRIRTDADGATSHPRVWAGGDCRAGGRDLTVEAVEQGKRAAQAIDRTIGLSPVRHLDKEARHG
ncbi:NAD(P)-dependent oxidoreductase [Roseateles saccharophilus]|uniref:Glutamate synthase (NADPH/NADH) small chain n=1 Tax=Roseateles saccharophilus TaxID=304 RepID=A0A4R3UEW9_ROSSA|nr:NAD(P)-dependent oxidoreductase [Roseateles saccharophilus]MDG0835080.1 NAD(P)-dependent oxidoreductase [Roseateles saccharophilus]TCU88258.1 glutamate synthase (NADPH/NADH) small chain [Roseateles saccharophilus]